MGFDEDDAAGPSDAPWLPARKAPAQGVEVAQGRVTSMTLGELPEELLWGSGAPKGGGEEEGRAGRAGIRSPLGLGRSRLPRKH